jgi:hypothetical protein
MRNIMRIDFTANKTDVDNDKKKYIFDFESLFIVEMSINMIDINSRRDIP